MSDEIGIVDELFATGKWSKDNAEAARRANFRCEYRDLDLLKDAHHYRLWHVDHIIPRKLIEQEGGDPDCLDNLAVACKPCNYDFKWSFDPRTTAGADAKREALIRAAKRYIGERRQTCEAEVARMRAIVGLP